MWKLLSELECVKEYGLGHRIAHLLGIQMLSKCSATIYKK
ncbi:hypothetical protein JOD17_002945 [Geomicrobium sediminis]|uniref:Uncharacterized protein n=1 Tax=Geomicrobium sediminis TaxID=1347788 RepID=A0ABS2PEJ6_9BACL|nr:hypothetical protein [Geomicrobium sediminis]